MRKLIAICAATVLFGADFAMADWVTLNKPGAVGRTSAQGINGSIIVGDYTDAVGTNRYGFIYNGQDPLDERNWTTFSAPGAIQTSPADIDGNNIIGYYSNNSGSYGFLYDMTKPAGDTSSWTILNNMPGVAESLLPTGISGNNVIGNYYGGTAGCNLGFLYDMTKPAGDISSWTQVNVNGAINTILGGIDCSSIVGYYNDLPDNHPGGSYHGEARGFLYSIDTGIYTLLDMPGAIETCPMGISGSNIIGSYRIANESDNILHAFLYDGVTWANIDIPGACKTSPTDIDGNNIVGYYGDPQGFIYTIPEPGTIVMLAGSGLFLLLGALRRRLLKT